MQNYDVIVLGSGSVGATLGAILARNDVRTLIVDEGSHPRSNADGESVTPAAAMLLRTLAERYRVPEIKTLSSFDNCRRIINTSFGVSRHHGVLLHRAGTTQDPREAAQMVSRDAAANLFCQDSDTYLFNTAIRLGCTVRQNYRLSALDIDGEGIVISGVDGTTYRSRYIVDATGRRSPLADKLGVREAPSRLTHAAHSQWTHMLGVRPTDEILARDGRAHNPPAPWHQGVVYHVFDGGYIWVIPFDNHPKSINRLCSVGLTLDPGKYAYDPPADPGAVFSEVVSKFPDIARQFNGATPVREWRRTESVPYSSMATTGERWSLIGPAAGLIDPLFSRGMSDAFEVMHVFAWRLLAALRDDDFSVERFEYVNRLQQRLLDTSDEMVSSAFSSFTDFTVLEAVLRVWKCEMSSATGMLRGALAGYAADRDSQNFVDLEDGAVPSALGSGHGAVIKAIGSMSKLCRSFRDGEENALRTVSGLNSVIAALGTAPDAERSRSRWRFARRQIAA